MVTFVVFKGIPARGVFQERPNRFIARVKVRDTVIPCFLPDPGRLDDLLIPGTEVILRKVPKQNRKTMYDLVAIVHEDRTVSVDSRVPNKLVLEVLKNQEIDEFAEYDVIKPEYSYDHTRFDFLLTNAHERCLLEVKSCTLVRHGIAMFPDAPTRRGRKHIRELIEAKKRGYRACFLFVIQRSDAKMFIPNDDIDPDFGKGLREAARKDVEIYAYHTELMGNKVFWREKVRVELKIKKSKSRKSGSFGQGKQDS